MRKRNLDGAGVKAVSCGLALGGGIVTALVIMLMVVAAYSAFVNNGHAEIVVASFFVGVCHFGMMLISAVAAASAITDKRLLVALLNCGGFLFIEAGAAALFCGGLRNSFILNVVFAVSGSLAGFLVISKSKKRGVGRGYKRRK